MKLTGHTYALQQFDKKDILISDGLEKAQLIQLGAFKRIKLALRNQGRLEPFARYLPLKIRNFAVDINWNYFKQFVFVKL